MMKSLNPSNIQRMRCIMKITTRKVLNILLTVSVFAVSGCYSCQPWNEAWGKGPREAFPPNKFFWDKECKPIVMAAPVKPAPAPVKPQPAVRSECGASSATGYYPCEGCTVAKLEKNMPTEVAMNTKFDYTIKGNRSVMGGTGLVMTSRG
jgi:hypothetical protein